ncbi:MAG: creatininase family protein [Bacteroidales bacterium]|nr:creatininase family protein [Bacteroidales bacterium]
MKRFPCTILAILFAYALQGQQTSSTSLPFKMEELTSPQFARAAELSKGVCIIPLGIIEKHGPHLPLGTDLFEAREAATEAAKKEYAIVFPPYFTGQIFEARHQPGTIAYSNELMWKMLEETCQELARNGLKKIVLVNGHGGSTSFLQYFCQSQLAARKDYIVVLFREGDEPVNAKEIQSLKKAKVDGHAGEEETSMMYFIRPDLVDVGAITNESGLDQKGLDKLPFGYTGIWWYASFPNHYASDVARPDKKLGELLIKRWSDQIAELVGYLKNNNNIEQLQEEFYQRAENPMKK